MIMDDLTLTRQKAIDWHKEAILEYIENNAGFWEVSEDAEVVADMIDNMVQISQWSDALTITIFECPMAPCGWGVRPEKIINNNAKGA